MPEYEQAYAPELFADGTYDFQCVDAAEKQSEKTHHAMIELQLDVCNADFTNHVRVVDRLVFTPNSYWKIDSFRKSTGEKIQQNAKVSFEAEDCVDRKGRLQLKTTSYNGKMRNEVDYYVEPEEFATASGAASAATPQAAAATRTTPPVTPAPKGTVPQAGQKF
jgi:hypothetical protein